MVNGLNMSLQIRRTPYTARVEAAGVRGFTVVNHMLLSLTVIGSSASTFWIILTALLAGEARSGSSARVSE